MSKIKRGVAIGIGIASPIIIPVVITVAVVMLAADYIFYVISRKNVMEDEL